MHEDCLSYAYKRLEEFKETSLALNEFDFCEPVFIQGKIIFLNVSKMTMVLHQMLHNNNIQQEIVLASYQVDNMIEYIVVQRVLKVTRYLLSNSYALEVY